jgi:hypothetical protein
MIKTREEWLKIIEEVRKTGKMANTLAKALAKRYAYRWQFVDFRGPGGQESAGIVDIVAIRKSGKRPANDGLKKLDLFDIILIQVKGGKADWPTDDDVKRLQLVRDEYKAQAIVLFEWKKKKIGQKGVARFLELDDRVSPPNDPWVATTTAKLFGKPGRSTKGSAK